MSVLGLSQPLTVARKVPFTASSTLACLGTNPHFRGPQDPDALAKHIFKSKGASGENDECLCMLEQASSQRVDRGERT